VHFGVTNEPVRRYAACLAAMLTLILLGLVAPALAQAESIEISHSANPTQDIPVSITVSGTADGNHKLYAYVNESESACPTDPFFNTGKTLVGGEALGSGSFSKEYSFTPPTVTSYTVCAYLDESGFGTPDATNNQSFSATLPSGSLAVEVSTNPTQDVPLTVKVSGTSEVAQKLYVYVDEGSGPCPTDPYFNTGTTLAGGEAISAGSFGKEYSYSPTSQTSYIVCAYIDEGGFATANATANAGFTTALPSGSVAVALSPTATENGVISITVSGSIEVPRKLYVYADEGGGPCPTDPYFNTGKSLAGGEAIGAGSFSKSYSYTPTNTSTYIVCAYIDEGGFATADATGSATFTNVTPQTRAEESARAAQKAAHEAERAAEVKKEQEAAAKEKYEAEAPARKAAKEAAEEAKYAAEVAAAKARAHKTPVKHLSVKAAAHAGHSSSDPGYTNLDITTSPYVHVVVKLSRYGHSTEHFEWGSHSTEVAEVIRWTCRSPGGTYRYVVTAKSNVGKTLTRTGHFSPVRIGRCHEYETQEAQARERREREVIAGYEQEAREEQERRERYDTNCRKLGGEPVSLNVGNEYRIYCKAPGGGTIPVPY
jgi:hypothetical protein